MKNETKHKVKLLLTWVITLVTTALFAQSGTVHFTADFSMRNGTLGHKYEMVSWDPSLYREFTYWLENASGGPAEFMNWRAIFPAGYNPAGPIKYPMIVMLHGAGESGREWTGRFVYPNTDPRYDNNGHNLLWGGREHRDAVTSSEFPGIIIFPQASFNGAWSGDWDGGVQNPNGRMAALIIEHMIDAWNVDQDRIAVHGLSNGAKGTWDMISKRPDLFAAAAPMSGVGTEMNAMTDIAVTTPIWQFQGGTDTNPSPGNTSNWITALENKGGNPRYTLYPSLGHGVWNTAYAEPDFFTWILDQDKKNIHVYGGSTTLCSDATIKLGISAGFLAYQWMRNGTDIGGATSRDYTANQAGTYTVRFQRRTDNQWATSNPVVIDAPGSGSAPVLAYTGSRFLPIQITGSVDNILNLVAPEGFSQYRWFKNGALWSTTTSNIKLVANNQGNSASFAGSYTVQVQLPAGCYSSSSNAIVVQFNNPQPTTPAFNITSRVPVSSTQINLTWDNPSGETAFEVWRYRQGNYVAGPPATGYPLEKFFLVATVDANVTTYADTGLRPGANYIYRVRAVVPGGASLSNQPNPTFVTTPADVIAPSAPPDFVATDVQATTIALGWSPSTDNDNDMIFGYEVYNNTTFLAFLRSDTTDADRTNGNPEPPTAYTVTGLTAGTAYTFKVRARDYKGNFGTYSTLLVSTEGEPVPEPAENGVAYKYWHFTGTLTDMSTFDFNQPTVEEGIVSNFDTSVRNREDQFVFEYNAFIQIDNPGIYRFYTNSDDGSMLYINGTTVVSNDGLHGPRTISGLYNFSAAGRYPIRVRFYEQASGQTLVVRYNAGSTDNYASATIIPDAILFLNDDGGPEPEPAQNGVAYNYFHFTGTLSNMSTFDFGQATVEEGVVSNIDISVRNREDQFVFEFNALIEIDNPGNYRFYTNSDDGSMLYIDGTTVVSNDGLHGLRTVSGTYNFPSAGKYPIRVTYYEQGGGQTLIVRYNVGTTDSYASATAIPNAILFLPEEPAAMESARVSADESQEVSAWPMPFQNRLNLAFKKAHGLENLVLLNHMGIPVMTIPVSPLDSDVVMELQDLPDGNYFLVVGKKTIRIVKRD